MLRPRLAVLVTLLGVFAACSGTTSESSTGDGGASTPDSGPCAKVACANEFVVEIGYRDPGAYVFDLTVDGTSSSCSATLPTPETGGVPVCSGNAQLSVRLTSMPSVVRLTIPRKPQTVKVHASRDGVTLDDATFSPSYVATPGPNGAGCSPESCTGATATLP